MAKNMNDLGVGIIGCGVISGIYMRNMPLFAGLKLIACADMRPESAKAQAEAYGIEALSVDDLLKRSDIDLVINLTVPNAHFAVSHAALTAGKHVFSEKPLCVTPDESRRLVAEAAKRKLQEFDRKHPELSKPPGNAATVTFNIYYEDANLTPAEQRASREAMKATFGHAVATAIFEAFLRTQRRR